MSAGNTRSRVDVHVAFLGAALAFALLGGLLLALALPIDAALRGAIGVSWIAHAQVHGHLQTIGFVGFFIVGMTYRLLPGFAGTARLPYPRLVWPSFWLLAGGLLGRAIGQPVAGNGAFAVLMAAGMWAEMAGAALFAVNVLPPSWRAARGGRPFALFFFAGALWLLVQSALGAVWFTELASQRGLALPGDRDGVLVFLQLFGFHLMFILGVAVRSFPVLFGAGAPTMRRTLPAWAIVHAGIALFVAGVLSEVWGVGDGWAAQDAGAILLGAGLLVATARTGWWRRPTRIRPASRPYTYALQPAMGWLAFASGLLVVFGASALLQGLVFTAVQWDAVRHIVAIGVVLMTIVGMAQLIVPELASERLAGRQGDWRGLAFGVALSLAVIARVFPRLLALPWSAWMWWAMAAAALIAIAVIAMLAVSFARGVRNYEAVIEAAAVRLQRPGPPREDW